MLVKIKREDCLKLYSKFPLREYDPKEDEEKFFYPKIYSTSGWMKLPSKSTKGLTKILATEISKLIKDLGYNKLIFLGDTDQYWISKLSIERDDYRPLKEALEYLESHKVGRRFNGALEVDQVELFTFLKHFYCLTGCDSSLPYFHFMDTGQNFIGYIHYTGEVRIDTLNKDAAVNISNAIAKTNFLNVSVTEKTMHQTAE
jgi:hypothetical protein